MFYEFAITTGVFDRFEGRMSRPIRHGRKWRIRYLDHQGKRLSEVFTTFKDAERALRLRQIEAEEIEAGIRKPALPQKTFNELADYWLEHRAKMKRSRKDDISILRAHLRPAFGALRINEIVVQEVDKFQATMRHLSPKTVANVLTLLTSMLNNAHELGWLDQVPRIRKPRIPFLSDDFKYLRTDDEIWRLLLSAKEEPEPCCVSGHSEFIRSKIRQPALVQHFHLFESFTTQASAAIMRQNRISGKGNLDFYDPRRYRCNSYKPASQKIWKWNQREMPIGLMTTG